MEQRERDGLDAAYLEALERVGYVVLDRSIDPETISRLVEGVEAVGAGDSVRRRGGEAFGIRDLFNVVPFAREVAADEALRAVVETVLGTGARAVRGLCFDKTPGANWKVGWHQDLTIAVRERREAEGFGPWSVKAGIVHVQPPVAVLETMLTLRLHLDDTGDEDGALRVIPGSHRRGRLTHREIQAIVAEGAFVTCPVRRGGVMAMQPLLLHASSPAVQPSHRRVLHFEYAAGKLPGGLEWHSF